MTRWWARLALLLWATSCAAPTPPITATESHELGAHALAHCHARGDLPDPQCTPGDVETTDLDIICHQSTKERRDVTQATKHAVEDAYGSPRVVPEGSREVDHLISVELGGSGDPKNLWPQPAPQFKEKDRLENELHRLVCSGQMPLAEAQREIARDWRALERRLGR